MFLICCLITQIYLLFPKSYIFFARLNSIRTGLPFNTSWFLPVRGSKNTAFWWKCNFVPVVEFANLACTDAHKCRHPVLELSSPLGCWRGRGISGSSGLRGCLWATRTGWTDGSQGAHLPVHCCLLASNELAGYCLANKISNQYLKSKKDLYVCPKAGDFYPEKGWHTNSWFCINEWIKRQVQKQAAVRWIALKLTCFCQNRGLFC